MSKTLAELRDQLSEELGDYFHSSVTTALEADTDVIDTELANVEGGATTDYWEDWWFLPTSGENTTKRLITAYATSGTTISVLGNLADDGTTKATYELHRYDPSIKVRAINSAAREIYPYLYKKILNRELISGNIIPPFHFTSSSAIDLWTASASATIAETTTAGLYYGQRGSSSALITTTGASQYIYITSDQYPRLLDLKGQTVTAKVWVRPTTADDVYIIIYTIKADGTEQTLTSTTTAPAGKWTLLELEDQAINDNIEEIQIRLHVFTTTTTAYFMTPRVTGKIVRDYMSPLELQDGVVKRVRIQTSGVSDDPCDDIGVVAWEDVFGWDVVDDGTYKYLQMPGWYTNRMIELTGYAPLEDNLSADTDTMSINDPYTNLFIAQAALEFFRIMRGPATQEATGAYEREIAYYTDEVRRKLRTLRMAKPSGQIHWS